MSNADYHADNTAIGSTMIRTYLDKGARVFQGCYVTKTVDDFEETEPKKLGALAHAMIFDPVELAEQFVLIPGYVLSKAGTKAGGAWKDFEAANPGKTLVTQDTWDSAAAVCAEVQKKLGHILAPHGKAEHEIRWRDPLTGLDCKAKIDWLIANIIFDVKTSESCMPHACRKSVLDWGYHVQDAHYCDGFSVLYGERPRFLFAFVRKKQPIQCRLFELPEYEDLPDFRRIDKHRGRTLREAALLSLAERYAENDWSDPGEDQIITLTEENCR